VPNLNRQRHIADWLAPRRTTLGLVSAGALLLGALLSSGCPVPAATACTPGAGDCPNNAVCHPEQHICVLPYDGGPSVSADAATDSGEIEVDGSQPDSAGSDAATPDAAAPDTAVADAAQPDTTGVDVASMDSAAPDSAADDSAGLDVSAADVRQSDVSQPDVGQADSAQPDSAGTDAAGTDAAVPDSAQPDSQLPDTLLPDALLPDGAAPDTLLPDALLPDGAAPDTSLPDTLLPDAGFAADAQTPTHQVGAVTIADTEAQVTIDLADTVDENASLLFFNCTTSSITPADGHLAGNLINGGSQVQFTRSAAATGVEIDVEWSVVELSGVSVQRGSTPGYDTPGGTQYASWPQTISQVVVGRSFPLASLYMLGGTYSTDDFVATSLADGQTLSFDRSDGWGDTMMEWQVAELPASGADVYSGSFQLPAATASDTTAIGATVDPASAFLIFSYQVTEDPNNPGASPGDFVVRGHISGASQLSFSRHVSVNIIDIAWFVVSWDQMSVLRGEESFTATQTDRTVSLPRQVAINRAVSFCPAIMRGGSTDQADDANDHIGAAWFTTALTSAGTELQLHRGSDLGNASVNWTVVEFP